MGQAVSTLTLWTLDVKRSKRDRRQRLPANSMAPPTLQLQVAQVETAFWQLNSNSTTTNPLRDRLRHRYLRVIISWWIPMPQCSHFPYPFCQQQRPRRRLSYRSTSSSIITITWTTAAVWVMAFMTGMSSMTMRVATPPVATNRNSSYSTHSTNRTHSINHHPTTATATANIRNYNGRRHYHHYHHHRRIIITIKALAQRQIPRS
jgi:hypothetical protein